MNQRCGNSHNPKFPTYGGRGITICDRWQGEHGFENFLADMGQKPNGLTLDRIDNNGNYEPGNCRWATYAEQSRNRSDNVQIEYGGRTLTLEDWSHVLGISRYTLRQRLSKWPVERAFRQPVRGHRPYKTRRKGNNA